MKKIILLCFVFKALNLHGIWKNFLYPFKTDNKLTQKQKSEMEKYQDLRSTPGETFPLVCECITCGNYVWNTCGSQSWVKSGECFYADPHTLQGC
jgi:hypothetical protein